MENVIKTDHPMRDQLLQVMIDNAGSDMFITAGTHPAIKIAGEITSIDEDIEVFSWKDTYDFARSLIDDWQEEKLQNRKNLDFSFSYA